jgi:protein-tyrosine phosphatase
MLEAITTYINDRYGSKRGLLNHWRFGVQYRLGRFSSYVEIDWSRVERLVFICAGNICRSPLAEAVATKLGGQAISAGIACDGGHPADLRVITLAESWGLELNAHRSKPLQLIDLTPSDLIVGMEPHHLSGPLFGDQYSAQFTLLGLWGAPPRVYIHDPYGATPLFFECCEQYVMEATKLLVRRWLQRREVFTGRGVGVPSA